MAEGDIGAEIDRLEFEAGTCNNPKLIHVKDDVFAIAYTGPDNDGWIQTVSIDSAGVIPAAVLGSLEFDDTEANNIGFIKVAAGVFAVVYRGPGNDGWIKTLTISDDGTTLALVGAGFEFDTSACYYPAICKVANNVFAVVYSNSSIQGRLITVGISDAGLITDPILDFLIYDATRSYGQQIVHAVGDFFAITYQGPDDDGWIATVDIDSAGEIEASIEDSFEFDAADIGQALMLRIVAGVFVIAYKEAGNAGDLVTVSIDAAGDIGAGILDDQEFDVTTGLEPCIIHVSGNVFAIAFSGILGDGWLRTWSIDTEGVIAAAKIDELEFDTSDGRFPCILHVSGNIYAIAYARGNTAGQVISVDIETVAAAAATHHLPLMGVG